MGQWMPWEFLCTSQLPKYTHAVPPANAAARASQDAAAGPRDRVLVLTNEASRCLFLLDLFPTAVLTGDPGSGKTTLAEAAVLSRAVDAAGRGRMRFVLAPHSQPPQPTRFRSF